VKLTTNVEKQEHSAVKLTVTVKKADVASVYAEVCTRVTKSVQVPGFRKGHVPLNVLERKYGDALRAEAGDKIVEKAFRELFADPPKKSRAKAGGEEKPDALPLPLSDPRLSDAALPDVAADFTFSLVYDVYPQVTVAGVADITIEEPVVVVGKEDVDAELKLIQERNALIVDKAEDAAAETGDVVTIDYVELDDEGGEKADSARTDFVLTIGDGQNFFLTDDHVTGLKKGESRDIEAGSGDTKFKLRVTMKAVKRRDLPEIDDDLAQDVSEKYQTLADLTADIEKKLLQQGEAAVRDLKVKDILAQLTAKNVIDLPLSMLNAQVEAGWEQMVYQMMDPATGMVPTAFTDMKEHMRPELEAKAAAQIRDSLVLHALIEDRKIEATDADVEAEKARLVAEEELSEDYVKKAFEEPQEVDRVKHYIIEKKVIDQILAEVKVTKGKPITLKELTNPVNKEEK
jgi:trigger factor